MRLIDADKLIKAIKDDVEFSEECCLKNLFTKGYCVGMRKARSFVYNQPTVDAIKHGQWITYPTLVSFLRCNRCQNGISWHNDKKPNFCPHCGAIMGVEDNEL